MRSTLFDTLGAVTEAARTVMGWILSVLLTAVIGAWLGLWLGHRSVPGPVAGFGPVLFSCLLCLLYLPSSIAVGITLAAIYLPINFDRWRVAALGVTLLTWFVVVASCASREGFPW
jgi:hypothetical protein